MRGVLAAAVVALSVGAPTLVTAQSAATTPASQDAVAAASPLVVEAQALMANYAAVILAGDHAGIAALYEPEGAWIVHAGEARFLAHDAIARRYAEHWEAPVAFEWRDLTYVPSGEDSITVIGRFLWTVAAGQEAELLSYHGLFVRRDGRLLIRVEDEALVPAD